MVFTTGTIGTLITAAVLKLFKITDDETVGLALGVTAHGLGTARAMQISERAGAFAALGMSLMGIISAILIPYVFLSIAVPMTVRRLYVPQSLGAGASITLDKDQVHYLVNVLRMGIGDAVALFNAESGEWNGMLEAGSQKSDIKVKLLAQTKSSLQPPASNLTLCFAPLKKTRTDFLVEKASELGVHILQPIITEHTNSERVKVERLQQIVIEAAEQCDRLDVPVVRAPLKLEKLLEAANNTTIFLAAERGDAQPIATAFQNTPPAANTVFIIGPEGGFSDAEFQLFDRYPNIVRLRLGPRLLRAETAALAVLSAYQSQMGDWKY